MNRKAIKKRRLMLLNEQAILDEKRCENCRTGNTASECASCSCQAAVRIREIGEELNQLSRDRRQPPAALNLEAYHLLKDWEWDNKRIRDHYGINNYDFKFWMQSNGLTTRKPKTEEEPEVVAKANEKLTVELYMDLKAKGMSDAKIGEQFGMKQSQVSYWRKKQGVDSVRDAKQKRIEAIVGGAKAEKESAPVVKVQGKTVVKPEEYEIKRLRAELEERHNEIVRLKQTSGKFAKLYDEEQKRTEGLEQQLKVAKAEIDRIRHLQDQSTDYKALQRDYETMTKSWKEQLERAEKADEIALEANEWRRKYEHEHLNFLEANAVIMEQKEMMRAMNDAWDDDTEETKGELQGLREQNAYLKAELQNAKKIQGIHDEFKVKAVQQVQKKNKLIHALMDYYREEA